MIRFDDFLRSKLVTTVFLLAAIAAQAPHAAFVFYATANDSMVTAWLAAFALESAVLHFVLHGQKRVSYMFASVSVAMNLAYYHLHDVSIFSVAGLTAWLLAISLPVAIAFYSHSIAEQATEDADAKISDLGRFAGEWVLDPMIAGKTPTKRPDAATEDSSADDEPADFEFPMIPSQMQSAVTETEPIAFAVAPEPERRETGVERNRRLAAERAADETRLHGLSVDERRSELRKMRANGHANTAKIELAQIFGVAPSTITRDFQEMGLQ